MWFWAELWFCRSKCKEAFNKITVSSYCALKKIFWIPKFYRNHLTCSVVGALTFTHFVNIKITRFLWWLKNCRSICFYYFEHYFFRSSTFIDRFKQMWQDVYSVSDVLDNDLMALLYRIAYVQERDHISMFVGVGS